MSQENAVLAFLKGLTGGPAPAQEPRPIADKPWEDPSLAPAEGSPAPVEPPAPMGVEPTPEPVQPQSEVEAIIEALDKRNRGMVDLYGEGPPK